MKKVEVEFETSFTGEVIYKHLARIYLGDYIGRLALCPDGVVRLHIDKKAADEGFIVLDASYEEDVTLTGFGLPIVKKP